MKPHAKLRQLAIAARDSGQAGLSNEFIAFMDEATPDVILALLDELEAKPVKMKKADYPEPFLAALAAMERVGMKWLAGSTTASAFKAWKARTVAGAEPAEILAGADKYARYCKATDRKVMMAQTFFGPQELFTADWTIPARGAAMRPNGKFDPVAHVNQSSMPVGEWDGIIDITPY